MANDQKEILDELKKRFQPAPGQAFDKLHSTCYSLKDCQNKRNLSEYVAQIQSAANNCGITEEFGIVMLAWKYLDINLRVDIPEPQQGDTVDMFITLLRRHQSNWFDKFALLQGNACTLIGAISQAQRTIAPYF
jgi:hypothetical protein